jgi:ATP/maltotriose-dependent transcriptional regulator MalT
MALPILTTKLYIPPPRSGVVPRPHLLERLDDGLSARRKLTLVSAPAGFGKSTLVSEWIHTGVGSKEDGVGEAYSERDDAAPTLPSDSRHATFRFT